ncbi:arp2/3 complex-activating protein rickA-like isoform X2 [Planococcus citri]|uniref:arp2/3 complex-activating protein rickA-like isoform X2 n=1 Tax=Planococcus citri TaxID=170843 RepID=UPI0031FA2BA6
MEKESGLDALNKIKGTRDRFLAMQKLSKEIFDETIAKINELKHHHDQITSNADLLQKKKSALPMLEESNRLLDKRVIILENILHDKKQCIAEQETLLKKDQEDILSGRSSHCDRVYEYISNNEDQHSRPGPLIRNENDFMSKDFVDLAKQIENCENELRVLNEKELKTQLARKDLQSIEKLQKQEELQYQQLLDDKKETLKNLMQQVKHLKFNRRKYELSCTIENLYQQNSSQNVQPSGNNPNSEILNYFNHSTTADNSKSSEVLNKIKKMRAVNTSESNTTPSMYQAIRRLGPDQEEFKDAAVKRCKVSEKLPPSVIESSKSKIIPSVGDSYKLGESSDIAENTRRKFIPKKPLFSQK